MLPGMPETPDRPAAAGANVPAPARTSRLRTVEDWFCACLIFVMIAAGLLAVLRRFAVKLPVLGKLVLSGSLSWPEPLAQHLVLWVALFGAGAAAADRSHIAIDALSYVLPDRARRCVGALTNLVTTGVCALFAWLSVGFVVAELRDNPNDMTFFGLPSWWLTLVLPVGFTLLTLRGLEVAFADVRALLCRPSACDATPHDPPANGKDRPAA